jgi:lambda family phage portal protein
MLAGFRRRVGAWVAGGFDAALHSRRMRGFRASRAHVNAMLAAAGPEMTARARWLVRNNGYAANAVESWAANAVGEGIKPSATGVTGETKQALQALWLAWTDEADAEGLTDFYGLQRRAARECFIAGEVFVRLRPRRAEDGLRVPLQLEMLPSEMLPLRDWIDGNGNEVRQGIEIDAIGRRVAYHFHRRHPGEMGALRRGMPGDTVRVPAEEVVHIIDPVEAGQLRGVSRMAPAIVKLFLLDQYDDAELDRKKVAAMYAMFITSPAAENPLEPAEDEIEVAPGQVVRLDPGDDVKIGDPADSGGTYEPFQYRTLLQVSAALGVPYPFLTNDMVKGNFSNSRLALMEFRRRVTAWQHSVMVYQLCRPVWARWLDLADLAGAIRLAQYRARRTQYQACAWLPPRWAWVDPLKDINAEATEIEAGLKSRTQAVSERGYDVEQLDREIAEERAREAALGLDFRRAGSPAKAAGSRADARDDEDARDDAREDGREEDDDAA